MMRSAWRGMARGSLRHHFAMICAIRPRAVNRYVKSAPRDSGRLEAGATRAEAIPVFGCGRHIFRRIFNECRDEILNPYGPVWDSYGVQGLIQLFLMRPSSFVRLGIAVCGVLLLSLLSATVAHAAPSSKRHARFVSRARCEARVSPRRVKAARVKANRQTASYRPYFVRTPRLLHRRVSEWLERSRRRPLRDTDAAALQGSTPAVHACDDLLPASLEPLGVLASPQCPVPISGAVARRSPRGPPLSPGLV